MFSHSKYDAGCGSRLWITCTRSALYMSGSTNWHGKEHTLLGDTVIFGRLDKPDIICAISLVGMITDMMKK